MFFKGSRYATVGDLTITTAAGKEVKYKNFRFTPRTDARAGHLVHQGERLDHIAQRYYRDPERFWRIADANQVMRPEELTRKAAAIIMIPPSEG